MKKTLIFSSFLLFSWTSWAQDVQEYEIHGLTTTQAIVVFLDSARAISPFFDRVGVNFDCNLYHARLRYSIDPRWLAVDLPCVQDEETARYIFRLIDSLAQTSNFINLRFVNIVAHHLVLLGQKSADWQKEIALKSALLDLDYSARSTNSWPAITGLSGTLFTEDITNRIREIFRSPFLTRADAEILAQSARIQRTPIDTTGYAELEERYRMRTLTTEEGNRFMFLNRWLERFQQLGQTPEQFADSLNRMERELDVNRLEGIYWDGTTRIILHAGQERIYSLAPLIDSFSQSEVRQKTEEVHSWTQAHFSQIPRVLARLNYKNYRQDVEKSSTRFIENSIAYLKNHPELGRDTVRQIARAIEQKNIDLAYIGVPIPDIYRKMIPLLLVENKMRDDVGLIVSVGAYFFWQHFRRIENIPWHWFPEDLLIEDTDRIGFPAKIHQWMIENKDNITPTRLIGYN